MIGSYMNTIGNKKLELLDTGAGASEPMVEENIQLASGKMYICVTFYLSFSVICLGDLSFLSTHHIPRIICYFFVAWMIVPVILMFSIKCQLFITFNFEQISILSCISSFVSLLVHLYIWKLHLFSFDSFQRCASRTYHYNSKPRVIFQKHIIMSWNWV